MEEKEKRYTVVLDAYLWAHSDEDAKAKAYKYAEYLQKLEDNHANVIGLNETPYGSLFTRVIEIKK